MEAELPKIISVDDHVVEPPHVWKTWLPAKYRERGTAVERRGIGQIKHLGGGNYEQTFDDDGPKADCWVYEDLVYINKRFVAAARLPTRRDDHGADHLRRDAPGLLRPRRAARRHGHQLGRGVALLPDVSQVLRTDLQRGEGQGARPGLRQGLQRLDGRGVVRRLRGTLDPAAIIPLWDVELAAAEVRRNAARGVHAVCFSEIPPYLGLPSIHSGYWDPFFAACAETAHRRLHAHRVFVEDAGDLSRRARRRSRRRSSSTTPWRRSPTSCSPASWSGSRPAAGLLRGPDRLASLHARAGRHVWEEHRAWATLKDLVPEPPSTYYYRQVYGCFFRDQHGLNSLDEIGEDNVTFETDYPHTDSTWPDTKKLAEEMMSHLTDEDVYKIVRGNAIRMLSLDIT